MYPQTPVGASHFGQHAFTAHRIRDDLGVDSNGGIPPAVYYPQDSGFVYGCDEVRLSSTQAALICELRALLRGAPKTPPPSIVPEWRYNLVGIDVVKIGRYASGEVNSAAIIKLPGTPVALTATPNEVSRFAGWSPTPAPTWWCRPITIWFAPPLSSRAISAPEPSYPTSTGAGPTTWPVSPAPGESSTPPTAPLGSTSPAP